jgi:hypothetical protein
MKADHYLSDYSVLFYAILTTYVYEHSINSISRLNGNRCIFADPQTLRTVIVTTKLATVIIVLKIYKIVNMTKYEMT